MAVRAAVRAKVEKERVAPRLMPEWEETEVGTVDELLSGRFVEERRFEDLHLTGQRVGALAVGQSYFDRVSFARCEVGSVKWSDVRLVGCDLSNARFRHFEATRVEFVRCKLVGMNAVGCRWQDVLLEECDASLIQLSDARLERWEARGTQLREAAINSAELKGVRWREVNLREADLAETSLQDVDLRGCELEGITLKVEDLRGAIVSAPQAMELARFLGLVVR